jgi:hypothetical protein
MIFKQAMRPELLAQIKPAFLFDRSALFNHNAQRMPFTVKIWKQSSYRELVKGATTIGSKAVKKALPVPSSQGHEGRWSPKSYQNEVDCSARVKGT